MLVNIHLSKVQKTKQCCVIKVTQKEKKTLNFTSEGMIILNT